MMNYKILLLLTLWSCLQFTSTYSQYKYEELIQPRFDFTVEKSKGLGNHMIILKKDTLFAKKHSDKKLDFLRSSEYEYDNMIKYYQRIVFCYLTRYPKHTYYLSQWKNDIIIYLDPQLPKLVRLGFKDFYSDESFKKIKNLNISFTNKLKNATYHIKSTSKDINGYQKDFKFETEAQRKNNILTGVTYTLQGHDNNNFFASTLSINPKKIGTDKAILKRLKQVFFKSLGNFVADNYKDPSSLLHTEYDNSFFVSQFDLNVLKLHYSVLFEQPVDYITHRKLIKLANKND